MKSRKTTTAKGLSKSREMVSVGPVVKKVTPEARLHMIAKAACFRAEHRDFQGGSQDRDWLESEVEIDSLLAP